MTSVMIRNLSLYDDEPYDNERKERSYEKSRGGNNKVNRYVKEAYERCIMQADEAIMAGDRIIAEVYYQRAEHYLHLMKRQGIYDL